MTVWVKARENLHRGYVVKLAEVNLPPGRALRQTARTRRMASVDGKTSNQVIQSRRLDSRFSSDDTICQWHYIHSLRTTLQEEIRSPSIGGAGRMLCCSPTTRRRLSQMCATQRSDGVVFVSLPDRTDGGNAFVAS